MDCAVTGCNPWRRSRGHSNLQVRAARRASTPSAPRAGSADARGADRRACNTDVSPRPDLCARPPRPNRRGSQKLSVLARPALSDGKATSIPGCQAAPYPASLLQRPRAAGPVAAGRPRRYAKPHHATRGRREGMMRDQTDATTTSKRLQRRALMAGVAAVARHASPKHLPRLGARRYPGLSTQNLRRSTHGQETDGLQARHSG
jgi:hypothetical protein